jgi:hypothetical protein
MVGFVITMDPIQACQFLEIKDAYEVKKIQYFISHRTPSFFPSEFTMKVYFSQISAIFLLQL